MIVSRKPTPKPTRNPKTILATLKSTTLLALFNTPQLAAVAQKVEDTIVKIMQKAAAG